MAKHLNISLGVTADTSKAKAQLQDLQNQLTKIINSPTSNEFTLTKDLKEASAAATELQAHLQRATNVDTGTLDFTKLSQSLKSSGKELQDYAYSLLQIGPDGEKAFLQLTKSIAQSEIPMKRINKQFDEMWTTLKNSARWQLSSSILHGFMSSVSKAYNYSKDLNESLTNIRIVTGQNTDQMAKFAKEANAAAKALSTTTTRYTNASLIYYQQGLSDEEVKKRTDITVKMANAAGQSAETVSDQLTAVWNNFYDGTKSLEHYADVMTALGAATASSTDEIAGGLEKFAAVADTIGLSYEYAASALATITSNTRQSEEVVGTALKTIFARIQGLNLGETLEDGTSLNKYSAALESVGISIFDTTGELKKMDNILNELGNKWQTLGKDQQVALAQTVAGVRQYNQLVSLMDNWNNGDNDSFQANLNTAQNSEGALQEQADIYAEGWEAASDRVRASMEGIYETIMDDDAFIEILDSFAEIIQYTDRLIDGMGGLSGMLTTIGAIATKVFSKQLASSLSNTAYGIKMMMPGSYKKARDEKQNTVLGMVQDYVNFGASNPNENQAITKVYTDILNTQLAITENGHKLNELDQHRLDILKSQQQVLGDNYIELQKQISLNNEKSFDKITDLRTYGVLDTPLKDFQNDINHMSKISLAFEEIQRTGRTTSETIATIRTSFGMLGNAAQRSISGSVKKSMKELINLSNYTEEEIEELIIAFKKYYNKEKQSLSDSTGEVNKSKKAFDELSQALHRNNELMNQSSNTQKRFKSNTKEINALLAKSSETIKHWSESVVACSHALLSFINAVKTFKAMGDVWNDDSLTTWEKFSTTVGDLLFTIPLLISGFNQLRNAKILDTTVTLINTAAAWLEKKASDEVAKSDLKEAAASTAAAAANTKEAKASTAAAVANTAAAKAANKATIANTGMALSLMGVGAASKFSNSLMGQNQLLLDGTVKKTNKLWDAINRLGTALKPFSSTIGWVAGGLTAIIITGVKLNSILNEQQLAVEEVNDSAKKLSDAYEDVKNSYEAFKEALNGYDSEVKGLEELTFGTLEYKEALLRANEQAWALIEANEELQGKYYYKDGLIKFDDGVLEELEEKKLKNRELALNYKIESSQDVKTQQIKAARESFRNNITDTTITEEDIDKIVEAYRNNNDLFKGSKTEVLGKFTNAGFDNAGILHREKDELEKLVLDIINNNKEQKSTQALITKNTFEEEIKNSNLSTGKQDLLSSILNNELYSKKEALKKSYVDYDGSNYEQILDQAEAFGEAYGYTISKKPTTATGKVVYTDSEGNKKTFSREKIASFAALQDATTEVANNFEKNAKLVQNAAEKLNDVQSEALASFADGEIGDLSKLTADEINSLGETIGISLDEFGNEIDKETTELEKVLNNGQDIGDAFIQAKANIEQAKAEYVNSLAIKSETTGLISRSIQDAFNSLDTSNVSLEGSKAIGNVLKNAFIEGGSEGLTAAQNLFAAAGDKAGEVANIVGSIDWQTATVETLNERLIDAGIHIPKASGALAEFVDWINKVRGAASAASNSEFYNSTQEILEQMKSGGTITKEQLDYLRNSENADIKALANNFQYNADGTFGFKGTNADVYKAEEMLNQEYHNRFGSSAKEFAEEAQNIKSLEGIDINKLTNDQKILAIESLMSGALTEAEAVQFAELRELNPEEITGRRQKELNNILNAHSDLYNQDSINAAYEDKMFESQMNMQADLSLAENEEEVKEWLETYKEVPGAVDAAKKQLQELNNSLLADELGIEKEKIDQVAKSYMDMGMSAEEAYSKAEQHLRLNDGLSKLVEGWEDYKKVLSDTREGAETTEEHIQAMEEMQSILSNITGISKKDIFTKEWVKKNIGLIEQVSKGSQTALEKIQDQFAEMRAQEAVLKIVGETDFSKVDPELQTLSSKIADFMVNNDIKVGATLDSGPFLESLNAILKTTGWTAEQVRGFLLELGYDAEVEMTTKDWEWDVPIFEAMNDDGSGISSNSPIDGGSQSGTRKVKGTIQVPAIKTITKTGQSFGGNVNFNNSSAGAAGGGGSDEPTKMEYTKEIDFYDRYKEWDDALDDIDDVLSDIQKEEEVLYGQNKISAMKKHNKMLLEEVEALQQKKKEALAYFEIDKQNLQNAAGALGYNIDFGSRDQILNYTSTMQGLFDELHAMEVHFNSLGSGKAQQQYKKDVLDPFNQKVDDLKQYIDQYDETRELLEDLDNEITDSVLEWKGLNYDILHYELEIKVEINDIALTRLDYYLKKYEDDFYSLSESAAVLFDKLEPTLNKLKAYGDFYEDTTKVWDSTTQQYGEIMDGVTESTKEANEERLDAMSGGLVGAFSGVGVVENNVEDYYKQAANGPIAVGETGYIDALSRDITQADYAEGLKEVIEGMYEELGNLDEIDKQFMEFYGQAIEMAREELEFYTGSLEHLTNSLKHYNKVAEITGRTNDMAFSKKMLDAQAKMVENQLSVAASNYEMYKQQQEHWKAQLATAVEGSAEWELYQENLKKAVKATEEAQDEMLSKTEEWAEALKAILENNLTDASRILENALTGGTSFDAMNKALERAESLQEEYLTDTNKIYETEKLMRQTRQEIDKTTNNAAKLRLNMFLTETEQLQTQNRLSEYELSIQQAKYQLLLAELAVEEAKNAKSTVRLQRDFEGNFGYVYTADQDQIDSAMQNLDDKRNELYNIGLEGANNYTSKYLSTLEAMYNEFNTIQQNNLNGMYESEQEYQNAMTEAYEYYFAKLKEYEELYGIAIRTDSRVTADAWSTDFQDMIYNTEVWADECDIYISQVTDLFEEWGETSEDLNQIVEDTTGTIDEIVRASDELAASINDNVVPGLQQELDLLNEILKAYGLIRDEILEEQKYREEQAARAEQDLREEAERDDYDDDDDFEQEKPTKAKRNNKKETTPTPKSPVGGGTVTKTTTINSYVQSFVNDDGSIIDERNKGVVNITTTSAGGYYADYNKTQNNNNHNSKRDPGSNTVIMTHSPKTETVDWRDLKNSDGSEFATGGYTGAWGPEGKRAILHEKELVLNKTDTDNILQAVDMVRQISTGIDQQASYQRIATLITQTLQDRKDNDVLEQHVTIEARFDNVRDRYEIEAAFDNLINKASQYANRDYKASAPAKINRTRSAKSF